MGTQIKIRTDHSALMWLRRTPQPSGQKARWLEILEEYEFSIEHRPGAKHSNADAMSRRFCKVRDCVCRYRRDDNESEILQENELFDRVNVGIKAAK